jgi:hypothetical protein
MILLRLQFGLVSGEDIINWADSEIVRLDSPPEELIDLATSNASQIDEHLSYLNALAQGAEFWNAAKTLIG